MNCNIKPCNGRILIKFKPADRERMTDTGIHIPDSAGKKDKLLPARVVAVADDVKECKQGDVVLVHHNDGFDIVAADHRTLLRFLSATGIYGVIEKEEAVGNGAEPQAKSGKGS